MSFGVVASAQLSVQGSLPGQKLALGLSEGSGTLAADSSGSGNNFTLSSGAAWTPGGRIGAALEGTAGYASGNFGGGAALSEWTIMCWVRLTSFTDCAIWGSSDDGLQLSVENTGNQGRVAVWSVQQDDGVIYNSPVLLLDTWTHIAITNASSDGLRLYVNGVYTYESLQHRPHLLDPASAFAFGAANHTGGENFQGQIDEVRVYDAELSDAEISAIMNTPIVEPSGPFSIFDGQPSVAWAVDGGNTAGINLGTEFQVATTCWVTHVRYLSGNDAVRLGRSYCTIYESPDGGVSGNILFTPVEMPAQTVLGEWVTLELPAPLEVHPLSSYMVVIWHPAGANAYLSTEHYFDSGVFASGQDLLKWPLIIPASVNSMHQGAFRYDYQTDVYPTNAYNSTAYYSDVIITL